MRQPDVIVDPTDHRTADLVKRWDALAESTGGSYFQTGTWAMSWWEHLAGRPETRLAFWTDGHDGIDAVCALSNVRQPLLRGSGPSISVWTNTGSGAGAGDHLGWPAREHLASAVLDWATRHTTGPILLANVAPDRAVGLDARGFELAEKVPTLAAPLGRGDDWFPGSNDFRKKLRYAGRQLDKLGVKVEMVGSDAIGRAMFGRLLELHAVRSEDMGWATHFDDGRLDFHMQLINAGRGPMACVARYDDTIVGVLYGFRFGTTFAYFQTGWSRDYVKQSLGSVLVATAMEWAAGDGAETFDFLRGDDEYKRRFGAQPRADETWMMSRGLAGRALKLRHSAAQLRDGR